MSRSKTASRIALAVVLGTAVVILLWWSRHRPSFLLYQAHSQLSQGNQAGVIAEYRRLLAHADLPAPQEVKLRKALGEVYVAALQESNDIDILPSGSNYAVENPFIEPAKKEFKRVLELDPSDSAAHYYMGRILWMQHLENYALDELHKSRETDPKNPSPLRYLAQIHLERGDAVTARDEALQSLALSPDYDEARLILVRCLTELGETAGALEEYDRLSEGFRSGPDAQSQYALLLMKANRWNEAYRALGLSEQQPFTNGRLLIAIGQYYLKRGRPRDASGAFGQAAALMPRSAWPMVWGIQASALNGDCEQSQRISQLLLEALPRWPWSYWGRAWNELCRNNADGAVQYLGEALRLSPDFSEAFELNARLLLDMGRYSELGTLLRPLIDKKHDQSFAYAMMAESLLDQQKNAVALEVAETAIKNDSTNVEAFLALGRARLNSGDRAGAQRAFENAQTLDSANPRVRAYSALAERSGADLQQVLLSLAREWPGGAEIWCLLGNLDQRLGDFNGALEAYQSAAASKPYHLNAQLGLVSSYTALRQPEQAAAASERAFQISPNHKDVSAWRNKQRSR